MSAQSAMRLFRLAAAPLRVEWAEQDTPNCLMFVTHGPRQDPSRPSGVVQCPLQTQQVSF